MYARECVAKGYRGFLAKNIADARACFMQRYATVLVDTLYKAVLILIDSILTISIVGTDRWDDSYFGDIPFGV